MVAPTENKQNWETHTNIGINTDIPLLGWGPYQCLSSVQYLV